MASIEIRITPSSEKTASELWSLDILVKENANFEDRYFSFLPD
jgi:hypothetical protein